MSDSVEKRFENDMMMMMMMMESRRKKTEGSLLGAAAETPVTICILHMAIPCKEDSQYTKNIQISASHKTRTETLNYTA